MFNVAKKFAYNRFDSSDDAFQKQLLAIISFFLFLCGCTWTIMYYTVYGPSIPFFASIAFVFTVLIGGVVAHRSKNILYLVYPIFYACSAAPFLAQWSAGTINEGAMVIIWGFLTPLGILIFTSLRPAIIAMFVFITCICITTIYRPQLGPEISTNSDMITFMLTMNITVSLTVNFITSAWFVYRIKVEKKVSEGLLLNILPQDIAEELKKYGKVAPVSHEYATVLFTDFKGFTKITEGITPTELVEEINYCFGAFDEITTKYHIEKIKTIGDSYMAVGTNFSSTGKADCTPADVVMAGLEMIAWINKRKKERDNMGMFGFEMRTGVHAGSIVSGVVGVKKFQFDIWGDTVNIASRMESNGEVSKLNISGDAQELLKNDFDFEYRGLLPVKGKADMPMYFVTKKMAG